MRDLRASFRRAYVSRLAIGRGAGAGVDSSVALSRSPFVAGLSSAPPTASIAVPVQPVQPVDPVDLRLHRAERPESPVLLTQDRTTHVLHVRGAGSFGGIGFARLHGRGDALVVIQPHLPQ